MNTSKGIQNQLLATKFFVPVAPGPLISRPRLSALLDKSLKYPLTFVSAPAPSLALLFLPSFSLHHTPAVNPCLPT